jgi:hypothetical protein
MTRSPFFGGLPLAALLASPGTALAQGTAEPPPRPFLRKVIQLNDAQLAAIEKGEVVTKQLPSPERPEIAAFGVVRAAGTLDTLRERMRDFQSFRKVPQIVQIGSFSNPPRIEDLQGLTWEDGDIKSLQDCKPGDCDVKGGTRALDRLKKEVDWSAPDAKAKASAVIKEQMVAYVKAYLAGGTDAMGVTVDKSKPKALSAEFRTLLKNSPYLVEYVAPFNQYLERYPKGTLADSEDVLFWTKDTFGLKPVVSIYHATVYKQEKPRPVLLAAMKTLYASHYFNAALEVMAAVPTPDATSTQPSLYVMDLYRTRIDPPTGMLSGVLMGKVKSGVEEGVAMNVKTAKARVEGK